MLYIAAFIAFFLVLWGVLIAVGPIARGTMSRAANLTAKLRYGDYLPVVLLLLIGAGITAFAGDQFVDLAELVVSKSPKLQEIDARWHDRIVSERNPGATPFFAAMSTVGGPVVLGVLTGIIAGALFIRKRFSRAAYLVVTAGGGALMNLELKRYFERARPALAQALRNAAGYSFPSGHAMGSTVVVGALTYLAVRVLSDWRQKSAVIALGITFVAAVSASRIYLGVHWLSDIIAGISAGLLWLTVTTLCYETFRRIRMIRALRAKGATTPELP